MRRPRPSCRRCGTGPAWVRRTSSASLRSFRAAARRSAAPLPDDRPPRDSAPSPTIQGRHARWSRSRSARCSGTACRSSRRNSPRGGTPAACSPATGSSAGRPARSPGCRCCWDRGRSETSSGSARTTGTCSRPARRARPAPPGGRCSESSPADRHSNRAGCSGRPRSETGRSAASPRRPRRLPLRRQRHRTGRSRRSVDGTWEQSLVSLEHSVGRGTESIVREEPITGRSGVDREPSHRNSSMPGHLCQVATPPQPRGAARDGRGDRDPRPQRRVAVYLDCLMTASPSSTSRRLTVITSRGRARRNSEARTANGISRARARRTISRSRPGGGLMKTR